MHQQYYANIYFITAVYSQSSHMTNLSEYFTLVSGDPHPVILFSPWWSDIQCNEMTRRKRDHIQSSKHYSTAVAKSRLKQNTKTFIQLLGCSLNMLFHFWQMRNGTNILSHLLARKEKCVISKVELFPKKIGKMKSWK